MKDRTEAAPPPHSRRNEGTDDTRGWHGLGALRANPVGIWIPAALAVLLVIGVVGTRLWSDFDLVAYISAVSSLTIAMLTIAYVSTTGQQLSVMGKQLDEMKKGREYQAQPLLVLERVSVELERPRFFYTPPTDEYTAQARVVAKFRVRNEGSHPAINSVLSGQFVIPLSDGRRSYSSASRLVEVLAEGASYPGDDGFEDFLFVHDVKGEILGCIREKSVKQSPVLKIRAIFKNTLGACYAADMAYQVSMAHASDEAPLTNWHASVVSFPVKFKNELKKLKKLEPNDKEWRALFEEAKHRFSADAMGPDEVSLDCRPVPLGFRMSPLSAEEYEAEARELQFGHHIPSWTEGCIASSDAT